MKIIRFFLSNLVLLFFISGITVAQDAGDILQGPSDEFGNAYELDAATDVTVDFTFGTSTLPNGVTFNGTQVRRDVIVRFTAKSGDDLATTNGTKVTVNGTELFTTEEFFGDERSFDFVINRSDLMSGANSIVFEPINSSGSPIWGIKEITSAYVDAIDLVIGETDANQYGYQQDPPRYTGLRANFNTNLLSNDFVLDVTGFDIDLGNETRLFLNGTSLGFLSTSPNNGFNAGDQFLLPKANLRLGVNQVEFVQRTTGTGWIGLESEKWAVTDLKLSELAPDLTPSSVTIQEPSIAPNVPFTVDTKIENIGSGSASPTVIRYYTSSDSIISKTDTFLDAHTIPGIAAQSFRTFTKSIQTTKVDQGVFFGVCIEARPNEVSDANNCSEGLLLDNEKPENDYLPAVIMLLSED